MESQSHLNQTFFVFLFVFPVLFLKNISVRIFILKFSPACFTFLLLANFNWKTNKWERPARIIFPIDADSWCGCQYLRHMMTHKIGSCHWYSIHLYCWSFPSSEENWAEIQTVKPFHGQYWTFEDQILPLRAVLVTDQTVSVKSYHLKSLNQVDTSHLATLSII